MRDVFATREAAKPATAPSEAWLFAQALLGRSIPSPAAAAAEERSKREFLAWLADISPEHERKRRAQLAAQADAAARRRQLEWLAQISTRHEAELRRLLAAEAAERQTKTRIQRFIEALTVQEADWDPAKHPRRGTPPNAGWFARKGTGMARSFKLPSGASAREPSAAGKPPSLVDKILGRNAQIANLGGVLTPGKIRAEKFAADVQSLARLPGDVAPAVLAGLGTGSKAVVNASATAIKDVVTLGLSTSQLELIGVTDEDRERGYDNSFTIATASGHLLIAVGTYGASTALSTGGTVARAAGGGLVAYDAAGNAVGVVKGSYDATQNGVTLNNGAQIAAGALGLGANVQAARGLKSSTATKPAPPALAKPAQNADEFVAGLARKPTPTTKAANRYEIKHTGPYNFTVSGGGATLDIDGYRGTTILEAKHVDNPAASPFVPGSSIPESIRSEILSKVRSELKKARTIIESGSTPFESVEIITNSPEAKAVFEGMLKELSIPGAVRLEP